MKKLLTLLGITAFALGAFADAALPSGTSFENHTAGKFDFTDDEPGTPGAKYWVSTASDIEASVAEYGSGEAFAKEVGRPAQFSGDNTQYLNIESASAPLYRAILPVGGELDTTDSLVSTNIGSGLYVDTLVQFSVAQGDQDVTDGNVKLAIWVQTGEEDGTPTNFYVHAGYFETASTLVATNYVMTAPANFDGDFNGWHRLTVKAIGDIGGDGFVGFVVFVDGDMLTRADNATIGTSPTLTAEAQQFAAGLLPSAVDNTNEGFNTLSAVGFSGNGSVDDISFTATAPDFAKSELVFSLTVGEGVTDFTLNDGQGNTTNVTGVAEKDVVNFTIAGYATTVTVSGVGYASDYKDAALSDENDGTVNGLIFTLGQDATNPSAKISAVRDLFTITVDGTTYGYATLAAAIADASRGTIVVAEDYNVGDHENARIEVNGNVTVDLAGHTISGPDNRAIFHAKAGASLTIVNTENTEGVLRGVADARKDAKALSAASTGSITIGSAEDGAFVVVEGSVPASATYIVKGKFEEANNSDDDEEFAVVEENIAPGSELATTAVDGYWVVDIAGAPEAPTYDFTVAEITNATATWTVDGVASAELTGLTNGTEVVVTYTANDGYRIATGKAVESYTINGADRNSDNQVTIEAAPTPETFVIRIVKDNFTTNDYESVDLAVGALESGDTLELLADCSDDIALPTGVAFNVGGYNYQGTVTAASGDGYEVVENGGVYTIVDNTASTWVGDDDDFWATASNWSTGLVPGQYTTVTFPNAGRVRFAEGNGSVNVGAMVVNANVTFSENNINYDNYPFINVCGGSISGTGTMTLERCGLKGNGTTLTVGCPVVFAGDSATSNDCFLQNGPIVFNGTVSSTLGRLHLQTPVTFNGAVNLENATMTSTVNGGAAPTFNGAVTLGTGATISTYAVTYNNALTIGEGAVVSVGSTSQSYGENFTMTGSGRFIGDTQLPSGKAKTALTQSTWTGTCELKGMTIKSVWWITDFGNENSKVCFNNVTTYLYNDGGVGSHMVAGIEIGSGGFKINGTYSSGNWRLPKLSGTGTFTVGTAGDNNKNVYLPADCSEFSGSIAFADDTANTRLVFGTTDREFKEKTICVGSDAVVGAGATWTASDEIYLDGIVKASANTSLSTVVGSGKIVYGARPTGTLAFGEWTGTVSLNYADIVSNTDFAAVANARGIAGSWVEIGENGTASGYLNSALTPSLKVTGFMEFKNGSTSRQPEIPGLTGDGVVVFTYFFNNGGETTKYLVSNLVDWNGVITNETSATHITNIVSGAGTVVFKRSTPAVTVGASFDGSIVYNVAPSAAPVVNAESEATVYLNFNYAGMNIAPYGNAKSTIKLGDLSAADAYLNDGSGSGTGQIPSKVIVAGDVTINNAWPLGSADWTSKKVVRFGNRLKVDGSLTFASKQSAWTGYGYYRADVLDASGAGRITVGNRFALRIDAVDFAEAPSGTGMLVDLTLAGDTAGLLYGPNGVAGEQIPVTVNGVATEQSLVYDAEKGGLVLYVASSEIDPDQGTTVDVDTTKSEEDQRAEAQTKADAMDVTKTTAAASVEQSAWNGYFTKKVEKVNDKWVATAALNPAAVLPVDDTVEEAKLTDMLKSVTAAALDDKTTTASVPTKPGLYYWIAGATEVGATTYTPGTATLGDGTTLPLAMPELDTKDGKAFYKVCVGVEAPVAE